MEFEYFEENGIDYVKEIYSDGSSIIYPKPSVETTPSMPEPQEPDQNIAILEGIANLFEKIETMEEKQTSLEENQMAILEGLAGAFEAQGEEA